MVVHQRIRLYLDDHMLAASQRQFEIRDMEVLLAVEFIPDL